MNCKQLCVSLFPFNSYFFLSRKKNTALGYLPFFDRQQIDQLKIVLPSLTRENCFHVCLFFIFLTQLSLFWNRVNNSTVPCSCKMFFIKTTVRQPIHICLLMGYTKLPMHLRMFQIKLITIILFLRWCFDVWINRKYLRFSKLTRWQCRLMNLR